MTPEVIRRFWSKVQRGPGCWEWQAGRFKRGYGMFNAGRVKNGQRVPEYAHRMAYTIVHGPIPAGLVVMHRCDNPPCCNPAHLVLGTQKDNLNDARAKGRMPTERNGRVLSVALKRVLLPLCDGRRGTIARLAREYGISFHALALAARRHHFRRSA